MGRHLTTDGRFRFGRYPELPCDKIILSFDDPDAWRALVVLAADVKDAELGADILTALRNAAARTAWPERKP